jgi:hypothetical protein
MRTLIPSAALVWALASPAVFAQGRTLVLITNTAEYFGNPYVKPPQNHAPFVFFAGEPVRVRVSIVNWGSSDATLSGADAAPLFTVKTYRDDEEVTLPVKVGAEATKVTGRFELVTPVETQTILKPGESLQWEADLRSAGLSPGAYRLEFDTPAKDGTGHRIFLQANRFAFELRTRSGESETELLRRDALRSFTAGDHIAAAAAISRLLRAYPNSAEAYVVLGDITKARGDAAAANAHYQRAVELYTQGADALYRQWATPGAIDHAISGVRSRMSAR